MTLQITIIEAQNLPRTDEGGRGKIDPFFKVTFAGQVYQTKIIQNDLNPKFNETFTFVDSPRKDQLIVELFDDDQNGTAKLISTYVVSSDALPTGKATIPLTQSNGASAGQVVLELVHIAPVPVVQPQVVIVNTPPPQRNLPATVVVQSPAPAVVVQAPATKSLQITIIEGKNLPILSSAGGSKRKGDKIDPFFKVKLGNQLYQTKIFQNEQNPKFNETFVFQDTTSKKDKVNFELYNNDGGAGQLIATYVLDTDKIPSGRASLPLQTPQGVSCGQVDLEIIHLESAPALVPTKSGPQRNPPATVVVQAPAPAVVVQAPVAKSLQITIIEGKNLPILSSAGGSKRKGDKIDPFFKVKLGNQLYQTKIFQNNQNPRFDETFVFQDTPSKKDRVIFELYNNDGGAGQLIATYALDTDKIPTGIASLPLQTPQGVACGQLDLQIVHLESAPAVTSSRGLPGPATTVVVQTGPQKAVPATVVVQTGPQKGRK